MTVQTEHLGADARAVLLSIGNWLVADMLLAEAGRDYARTSFWGGTLREPFGDSAWFQCERRGVLVTQTEHPPEMYDARGFATEEAMAQVVRRELLLIPWSQIAAHGRALPAAVHAELVDAARAHTETSRAWTAPRYSVRYPRRRLTPPQRTTQQRLLDAHRAARDRLQRALTAALTVQTARVPAQLELFSDAA